MSNTYDIEYTDTFGGEANYSWVRRAVIVVPELTHYGYDGGQGYGRANRIANREIMKQAKAKMGLTNVRGKSQTYGDTLEFRPYGSSTVMFISYRDAEI